MRVHLYTADEVERTFIEENLDNYVFEGGTINEAQQLKLREVAAVSYTHLTLPTIYSV